VKCRLRDLRRNGSGRALDECVAQVAKQSFSRYSSETFLSKFKVSIIESALSELGHDQQYESLPEQLEPSLQAWLCSIVRTLHHSLQQRALLLPSVFRCHSGSLFGGYNELLKFELRRGS
jgi:hypothetical protein